MKKLLYTTIAACMLTLGASAQDLPKPSPEATVKQRVGLTDISITYSRPGVKGRTIWGDLVPYNELWRAGANKATLFSVSSDIVINGQKLPAGDYSLFIIPQEAGEWTVIFNKETELWGEGNYKEENDQLRINVPAEMNPEIYERLEFHFTNLDMNMGELTMDWAGQRIRIPIHADPSEQVKTNIATALNNAKEEDKWKVYRNAASYARDAGMIKEGLEWIQKSVELKDNWYSYWVYGGLLAKNNEYKKAAEMGKKAIEIGKKEDPEFSYEARIQEDINTWTKG